MFGEPRHNISLLSVKRAIPSTRLKLNPQRIFLISGGRLKHVPYSPKFWSFLRFSSSWRFCHSVKSYSLIHSWASTSIGLKACATTDEPEEPLQTPNLGAKTTLHSLLNRSVFDSVKELHLYLRKHPGKWRHSRGMLLTSRRWCHGAKEEGSQYLGMYTGMLSSLLAQYKEL